MGDEGGQSGGRQNEMTLRLFPLLLLVFALGACKGNKPARPVSNAPIERYRLDGEIVQLDPEGHIAKIRHQKIEGWMEAMTMEFPVKDPSEFARLHVGDHITATVFVQDLNFWIGEIRQIR
jgi:Cu/Ag efflux protein CusF